MATRSYLIIELSNEDKAKYNTDKKYMGIYCHWDGYRGYVGRQLFKNYNTKKKVLKLMSFGDMSSISETTDKCIFYHRDRKEDLNIAFFDDINAEFVEGMIAFLYLFKDNKWHYRRAYRQNDIFRPLTMKNTQPSCY